MGIKLYIKDDLGREFTNREWANSDTKDFAGLFISEKKCLNEVEKYFHLNLNHFKQIQDMSGIDGEEVKETWFEIFLFLSEVKGLKRTLANISTPFGLNIQGLQTDLRESYGFDARFYIEEVTDYIQCGALYEDLEDLERLLFFLLHTKAKRIHLSYA